MNPVQYIILPRVHSMSEGKLAAQAAHASVEGVRISAKTAWGNPWDSTIVNRWYQGGHYAKIVLECDNLAVAERYIRDRGFKTALIIDEGRTEVEPLTETAIGVEILDKDTPHVRETFSTFKLYNPKPRFPDVFVIETNKRMTPERMDAVRDACHDNDLAKARHIASGGSFIPDDPAKGLPLDSEGKGWFRRTFDF